MADMSDIESAGLQQVANAIRAEASRAEKRKRGEESPDDEARDTKRISPQGSFGNGAEHASTAAAALGYAPMTVPAPTDLPFNTGSDSDQNNHSFMDNSQADGDSSFMQTPSGGRASKPQVGTEEWHKVRKDNHKEVERRRRETINEGINELAKIVPGCEKNKGSILQRAVQFITQLKDNETANIEKWTLEKLLTEQAIAELGAVNQKLKDECERAWREVDTWKKTCENAGLQRPADN